MSRIATFAALAVLTALPINEPSAGQDAAATNHKTVRALLDTVDPSVVNAAKMLANGQKTFRFDTFGDEDFWGGELRLNEAIATIGPATALSVGLKVDVDALPASLQSDLRHGKVDLANPATTARPAPPRCGDRRHQLLQRQRAQLDRHPMLAVPFDGR
jgi:hypothetical protein